jgi:hypothetical protein
MRTDLETYFAPSPLLSQYYAYFALESKTTLHFSNMILRKNLALLQ